MHLYEAPGVYTVRLTVSGPGGSNSVSKSALIQVSPDAGPAAPLAQFTFTPAQATAGQPVQFTDQSSGTISTWLWNFGDGQSSREQNPLHTYASAGVYTVTLTVYAKDELSSRSETTVVVGTNEALPHRLFLPALSR
ncbi:MAG: PKD domain-containing protein [Caldilineaceae bacterium]|nr:PKD domain-containing protein [Caldilineaceae bacterium]